MSAARAARGATRIDGERDNSPWEGGTSERDARQLIAYRLRRCGCAPAPRRGGRERRRAALGRAQLQRAAERGGRGARLVRGRRAAGGRARRRPAAPADRREAVDDTLERRDSLGRVAGQARDVARARTNRRSRGASSRGGCPAAPSVANASRWRPLRPARASSGRSRARGAAALRPRSARPSAAGSRRVARRSFAARAVVVSAAAPAAPASTMSSDSPAVSRRTRLTIRSPRTSTTPRSTPTCRRSGAARAAEARADDSPRSPARIRSASGAARPASPRSGRRPVPAPR